MTEKTFKEFSDFSSILEQQAGITRTLSVLQLGDASIEVTELLCSGESIPSATFFTKYDNYISRYKKYSAALSEMEAVGGFEYAAKIGRSVDFLMYNA